ncbi:MAG: DegT/DnrJ/EryC1/StrS family aminotransferase [Limnochordia bacterium]
MNALAINGGRPIRTKPFPKWPIHDARDVAAVTAVLESGEWWFGEKVAEFQRRFAAFHEAKYGVAVANGSVAIEVALKAAGVQPGDEVIVPPLTFVATATAVLNIGAIPVFADIEPQSLGLDPAEAAKVIGPRTKVILPVHLGGVAPNMDDILALAREHGLVVVEDAAQAHGSEWRGKRVGALGTAGTFSFQQSKNLTAGEGGIVLTNNPEVHELAYAYHNVGRKLQSAFYEHAVLGTNYRMTEMQAALLLVQMERMEEQMKRRDDNVHYLFDQVRQIEGLQPVAGSDGCTRCSWFVVRILFDPAVYSGITKPRFCAALRAEGIPANESYTTPLYALDVFKNIRETAPLAYEAGGRRLDYSTVRCPVAEKLGATYISFHHSAFLGDRSDMDDIAAALRKVYEHRHELAG